MHPAKHQKLGQDVEGSLFQLPRPDILEGRSPFLALLKLVLILYYLALHRFPLVKLVSSSPVLSDGDNSHPNSWSLHRLRHVQDYLYEKIGILVSIKELVQYVHDIGLVWAPTSNHVPRRSRSSDRPILPNVELSLLEPDADTSADGSLLAEDSGFFDVTDLLKDDYRLEEFTTQTVDTSDLITGFERKLSLGDSGDCPSVPKVTITISPSMSRRRLASSIPALKTHVDLPPPLSPTEILSLNGPIKSPRRSPGLTIKPPSRMATLPIASNVPITPVDQVMTKTNTPPKLERPPVKQLSAFSKELAKNGDISVEGMPPLSSPCLIHNSSGVLSVPLSTLFDAPPKTPVDQVMPVPSQPPALLRRTSKSEYRLVDRRSDCRGLLSDDDYITSESMRTPRPSFPTRCPSYKGQADELSPPDEEDSNPFLIDTINDTEATPRPPLMFPRSRLANLKTCPSPLFNLRKPLRELSTGNRLSLSSSTASLALPSSIPLPLKRLPLDSPLALDNSSSVARTPLSEHPSTPLIGAHEHLTAEAAGQKRVGTPSYFSARSYFVNH
jgi:hypothetical protein